MTSIVQNHYDGLAAGTLRAHQCTDCGALTFPMTTCCVECGCFTYDEVDLAGTGSLLFVSHNVAPATHPRFADIAPYVFGHVMLDEGIVAQGIIRDVDPTPETISKMFAEGPVPVRVDPLEMADLPVLAFRVV